MAGSGPGLSSPATRVRTVVLTVLASCFLYSRVSPCSPPVGWRPPSLVDEILLASDVLYGRVLNTYPDQRHSYGSGTPSTAYTVELEVFCILKGSQTQQVVNITGGGHIPGLCHSSNFSVNRDYVIIAYNSETGDDGERELSVARKEINPTPRNLLEIRSACGLNQPTRPSDASPSSSAVECPVSDKECQERPSTNQEERGDDDEEDGDDDDTDYNPYDENSDSASKLEMKGGKRPTANTATPATTLTWVKMAAAVCSSSALVILRLV